MADAPAIAMHLVRLTPVPGLALDGPNSITDQDNTVAGAASAAAEFGRLRTGGQ